MTYALLVQNLDADERKKFDADLTGAAENDRRALADLFGVPGNSGGEG